MSAFAKLYATENNPRSLIALVVAKYEGLTLDVVADHGVMSPTGPTADFLAKFPMGLVPTLEKGDFKLFEIIAIASFLASSNKANLLGASDEDKALVQQYMSLANSHLIRHLFGWWMPLAGRGQYNKLTTEAAKAEFLKIAAILEKTLANKTFFVGERITLADIFVSAILTRGFETVLDAAFRSAHPNITRHYNTITNQTAFAAVASPTAFVEKAITYTAPKKEAAAPKAPAAPKAAKAPKAKEDDEEEEPSAPAEPKAKHPCELLAAPKSFPLDEWKRQYSNSETADAMKWLDEHYDAQDYSLWKVTYKYPTELTQVFMSANLIGGFHNRLEGSRKYLFGSAAVYGVKDDSAIAGAYMIRGSNSTDVFDVAPDFESYEYTPLDIKADREFIEGCWSWNNSFDGKAFADAKVFK